MTGRNYDWALLLLRLTFGGLMIINHGWGKMLKLFGEGPVQFADPLGIGAEPSLWLAVLGEVVCPILLVLGLFTRLAALPALITMLVAAFIVHAGDPFADKEHALLFAIPYAILFLLGPGRYSVDHWWEQRQIAR
ncbi:MAG: DoxX family protein [Bacteroidetes bacterium]|nr:MAG: DoxX family protein [Bacteroidota bacterium]